MPKTFRIDGKLGVIAIGDDATIFDAILFPETNLANLNFHSSLPYTQITQKVVNTVPLVYDAFAQEYITWSDGGCDCFTHDTLVTLPDGSTKPIVEIQVGDKVLGVSGINTVTFIEKVPDTLWEYLYSPDPKFKPFATVNHPLIINGKLVAVDPIATWDLYPWLGKPEPLDHYELKMATGDYVYNLWVTGDGTYTTNGFTTTSIMFGGHFLSYSFNKGWLTQQEVVDLLAFYTSEGKYVQYGAYLINVGLSYVKVDFLLKYIAGQLRREKSLVKSIIVLGGKLLGKIFHPNR